MAQHNQNEKRQREPGEVEGIGADQGDSVPLPQPSAAAAEAVGAIGPGAVAAVEPVSDDVSPEPATEGSGQGAGLSPADREFLTAALPSNRDV